MTAPRGVGRILTDIRPLRESVDYRRLWVGHTVSQLGQQMATVTVAYQVFVITDSSFAVGVVGIVALVPLIVLGLYGGALVDHFDRRTVALVTAVGLWVCTAVLLAQALVGLESVVLLYAVVAVQSGLFAVNSPARSAIIPRLIPAHLLPAANALSMAAYNLGFTVGPLVGGVVIAWLGVAATYAIDLVTFTAAVYALVRLPPIPPLEAPRGVPGFRSVVEGMAWLRRAPNLRMTFVLDLCAMVLAQPRALFPALALTVYAGGPSALGLLQAAPAIGSLVAFMLSGWVGRVHRHGVAIVVAVVAYGVAVALAGASAIGAPGLMWLVVTMLAFSGSADMVSAAYRSTMLQQAAPDALRGRLQGLFTVVVAGGPRLGEFLAGSLAEITTIGVAMLCGGVACVVGTLVAVALQRGFLTYDARDPSP
ncbi:MFS transporter [Mumia sp. zg.B17]|uniref:MFS transporter n=1 Tax=Mumia sp. zg.B17 TaxID=2855446 RepID=UPI001C6E55B3|nr:MFS transporter [Mumia sp. zg.B17]MBW9206982.1 MFS transporter [Mumia sp. zg.B17]